MAKGGTLAGYGQVSAPPSTASSKARKVKRVLSSLRIEMAANGFTVSCSYSGPNGEYLDGRDPKPSVFEDTEDVIAYVRKMLPSKPEADGD